MGIIVLTMTLIHVPAIQNSIGHIVAEEISHKLGTKVSVGQVDIGLLNRIIIDDVLLYDQQNKEMIKVTRMSAKFELAPLISEGKIRITSAQLFTYACTFYKTNASAKPNYQFVLDSLASKGTTKHSSLDLSINSFIMRHGNIRYDRYDLPITHNTFNPNHLNISDFNADIILKTFNNKDLNLYVKKFSFSESSGLQVKNMTFNLTGEYALKKSVQEFANSSITLSDFSLELPNSSLNIDNLYAQYRFDKQNRIIPATFHFDCEISKSVIDPTDIRCFSPKLNKVNTPVYFSSSISGTSTRMRMSKLYLTAQDNSIRLASKISVNNWNGDRIEYFINVGSLSITQTGLQTLFTMINSKASTLPQKIGDVSFEGNIGGVAKDLIANGIFKTDAGNAIMRIGLRDGNTVHATIKSDGINLKRLTDNNKLGFISGNIDIKGKMTGNKYPDFLAKGLITKFDYHNYQYHNIDIDASCLSGIARGKISMNDANGIVDAKGQFDLQNPTRQYDISAIVKQLNLAALNVTNKWKEPIDAELHAESDRNNSQIQLNSDFAKIEMQGDYDITSIPSSISDIICSIMPSTPGLSGMRNKKTYKKNVINMSGVINNFDIINAFIGTGIKLHQPLTIKSTINDYTKDLMLSASIPEFEYNGKHYSQGVLAFATIGDTINGNVAITQFNDQNRPTNISLKAKAADNRLNTTLQWTNHEKHRFGGAISTSTQFYKTLLGNTGIKVDVQPSTLMINDTIWTLDQSKINFSDNHLGVDNFTLKHGGQHIIINGVASKSASDSLIVDLQEADLEYILDAVNFHSVKFGGYVTGRVNVKDVFTSAKASANITVKPFLFLDNEMGVLHANAEWNDGKIDIQAIANNPPDGIMSINGYVSVKDSYINLDIQPNNTNMAFLNDILGSVSDKIDMKGTGRINVFGPLKNINLQGEAVADGSMHIKSLNTTYQLQQDTVKLIPDEIMFPHCRVFDKYGNTAYIDGAVHHKHISNFSYDLNITAHNILGYDFKDFGDNTFCGTVFATGAVGIHGKPGRVNIDIDATPEKGSVFTYNAASPDAIATNEFIHWNNADSLSQQKETPKEGNDDKDDMRSDIYLNFLIHGNQNATLKVIMDAANGDYIALNGEGVIHANYYNKGAFQMFGTYNVDHGTYKLTIQNVIHKDFTFNQGGSIVFGGDPYNAVLNLKATYIVPAVSLSDLSVGNSFSNNNVRVNCIMNITGNPKSPKVDFDLELPTVNADEAQMVKSIINSEENMNQQVIYLLGIGRFYTQGANNAALSTAQQSQTSLAMQSILSGTLSNQINNLLSSIINNNNWNFGANITTGDEGWNNAEYEGLLSGRLLNNRLLINGQFGYRDNPTNATTSFVGDFDLQYLLLPNGNLSIKGYNHTNERYFTKSSLNTQGIGIMMKKDFNGLNDLFSKRKTKKSK